MRLRWIIGLVLLGILSGGPAWSQEGEKPLTLEESIKIALDRSLILHSSVVGVIGSEFRRKDAITNFLPTLTGQYSYTRNSDPISFGSTVRSTSRDIFNFNTALQQPLYTGGANSANYRLGQLGVDFSKTTVETVKRDTVLQVRQGYFSILTTEKFVDVGQQAVKQFEAQLEVARAFFEVGIVAKNDVLQAEVRLANAKQATVKAENDVAVAKASFNTLLRRDIRTPITLVDILDYSPFQLSFEESLNEALRQRPEIKAAQINIQEAKENVKVAKSGFYPTINLTGGYFRASDEPSVLGDASNDRWTILTVATFTLWNWGSTAYKVGENKVKVTQAEDAKGQLIDTVILEVKGDYLNMSTAEENIRVTKKAIEQGEENLRMNEERYKYQVATATDVLDAVTLLAQARLNYYSALGDFNIAKARLERAMGRMYP
jgi:outer membrane protein